MVLLYLNLLDHYNSSMSFCLWLSMVRMKTDCNLKTLDQLFKGKLLCCRKMTKRDHTLFSFYRVIIHFAQIILGYNLFTSWTKKYWIHHGKTPLRLGVCGATYQATNLQNQNPWRFRENLSHKNEAYFSWRIKSYAIKWLLTGNN